MLPHHNIHNSCVLLHLFLFHLHINRLLPTPTMKLKIHAMESTHTCELVPKSNNKHINNKHINNKNIVDSKWLFMTKHLPDGSIDRYKARTVAKGFTQTYGARLF